MSVFELISAGLVALAVVCGLARLLRGPDYFDRVLALDFLSIAGVCVAVLYFNNLGTFAALDVALLLAMVGFITALYFCRSYREDQAEGEGQRND